MLCPARLLACVRLANVGGLRSRSHGHCAAAAGDPCTVAAAAAVCGVIDALWLEE